MEKETIKQLSSKEIARGATNDPALSEASVTLGDRTFKIVDLPYDEYVSFLAHLKPLMDTFMGKIAAVQGMQLPEGSNLSAASLVTYCSDSLPEMARIVLRQTDPTITLEEVKQLGKNPFRLAGVVLAQIQQNKMIADFRDFFVQILPLMKAAAPVTEMPKRRKRTTEETRS